MAADYNDYFFPEEADSAINDYFFQNEVSEEVSAAAQQGTISMYALVLVVAVTVGLLLMHGLCRKKGLKGTTALNFALLALPLGLIGARLFYVVNRFSVFQEAGLELITKLWFGGYALWGGILGIVLAILLCSRLTAQPMRQVTDAAVLPGALAIGLFVLLRPGDVLLSVTGKPYDTLDSVIGIGGANGDGSLADFGVRYDAIEMKDGSVDVDAVCRRVREDESVRVVFIQRSKGYQNRRTLTPQEISAVYDAVHAVRDNVYLVVDNCYGEFTCSTEPRADLLVGSLIKNPGGGMALTGGYLAGSARAVELASYRLTTVGTGGEVGATLGQNRNMFLGLFYAPHTTAAALKTAHLAAYIFEHLGFEAEPHWSESRADIIQTVVTHDVHINMYFCRLILILQAV